MSIFDLFSTKKNKKEEQELNNLGLFKNEKKEYYIESIIQLNRWLDCIRKHTRIMYMLNSCRKVEEIPSVLMSESKYLIDKLDEIMS